MAATLFQKTSRARETYVQTFDAQHFNFQCANFDASQLSSMKESKREVQSVMEKNGLSGDYTLHFVMSMELVRLCSSLKLAEGNVRNRASRNTILMQAARTQKLTTIKHLSSDLPLC